jgi:hypothetical protein
VYRPARLLLAALLLLAGNPARAVVVLGDVQDPIFPVRRSAPAPSNLEIYVGYFGAFAGTPVGPRHFVTAAHIGDAGSGLFVFGNGTSNLTLYHASLAAKQDDLAIWKIADTDPPFSFWASLYTGADEGGQPLVVLGRGGSRGAPRCDNGVPCTDFDASNPLRGWAWGSGDGSFSWGTNTVDPGFPAGPGFLSFGFDGNAGPNEAILTDGDSGGPVFVLDPNGIYRLAGVASSVGRASLAPAGMPIAASLFDARTYYSGLALLDGPDPVPLYSNAVRISAKIAFIQSVVPEPGTASLVLSGLAILARASRRRRS